MYDTGVDRREIFSTPKVALVIGLALAFALACAHGQDLQAAQACTQLVDDAARLSCYDTVMGRSSSPKDLSAQVREVTSLPAGLYRLALDNGQVWETTQAASALTFKANDAVTITRGLLGSHQMSLAGHNTGVSVVRKQ